MTPNNKGEVVGALIYGGVITALVLATIRALALL